MNVIFGFSKIISTGKNTLGQKIRTFVLLKNPIIPQISLRASSGVISVFSARVVPSENTSLFLRFSKYQRKILNLCWRDLTNHNLVLFWNSVALTSLQTTFDLILQTRTYEPDKVGFEETFFVDLYLYHSLSLFFLGYMYCAHLCTYPIHYPLFCW